MALSLAQIRNTAGWTRANQIHPAVMARRAMCHFSTQLDEVDGLWSLLEQAECRTDADIALGKLRKAGLVRYWNSAEIQPQYSVSIEQLKTTTRAADIADAFGVKGSQQVEKIAALLACVVLSASLSAVGAQQSLTFLPDIWRFVVTQALCFAPQADSVNSSTSHHDDCLTQVWRYCPRYSAPRRVSTLLDRNLCSLSAHISRQARSA